MERVSLMKLNIQQESVLSKDERKAKLGGKQTSCYVVCGGNRWPIFFGCDHKMKSIRSAEMKHQSVADVKEHAINNVFLLKSIILVFFEFRSE
jgi:hypothetical protein